jgi:hypothetical protein
MIRTIRSACKSTRVGKTFTSNAAIPRWHSAICQHRAEPPSASSTRITRAQKCRRDDETAGIAASIELIHWCVPWGSRSCRRARRHRRRAKHSSGASRLRRRVSSGMGAIEAPCEAAGNRPLGWVRLTSVLVWQRAIYSSDVRSLQAISKTWRALAGDDLPRKTSEPVLVFAPSETMSFRASPFSPVGER